MSLTPDRAMKPAVLINSNLRKDNKYSLSFQYVESVRNAGALPIIAPIIRNSREADALLSHADGVLFTGGSDIDPKNYGEKTHPRTELLQPEKERSDEIILEAALRAKKPILGICYGCQLLNVHFGGTLHQHIPDLNSCKAHKDADGNFHKVFVSKNSMLARIFRKQELRVNSFHHQSIKATGRGVRVVAFAEDGLPEAIEFDSAKQFVLGVQWHPERMQDDENQRTLFKCFVSRCK